jgi:hypothetical protein
MKHAPVITSTTFYDPIWRWFALSHRWHRPVQCHTKAACPAVDWLRYMSDKSYSIAKTSAVNTLRTFFRIRPDMLLLSALDNNSLANSRPTFLLRAESRKVDSR